MLLTEVRYHDKWYDTNAKLEMRFSVGEEKHNQTWKLNLPRQPQLGYHWQKKYTCTKFMPICLSPCLPLDTIFSGSFLKTPASLWRQLQFQYFDVEKKTEIYSRLLPQLS